MTSTKRPTKLPSFHVFPEYSNVIYGAINTVFASASNKPNDNANDRKSNSTEYVKKREKDSAIKNSIVYSIYTVTYLTS